MRFEEFLVWITFYYLFVIVSGYPVLNVLFAEISYKETRKSGPSWRMNQFLRILGRRKTVFVCCSSEKCLKIVLQVRRSA